MNHLSEMSASVTAILGVQRRLIPRPPSPGSQQVAMEHRHSRPGKLTPLLSGGVPQLDSMNKVLHHPAPPFSPDPQPAG